MQVHSFAVAVLASLVFTGCVVPRSQLAKCEQQYQQLAEKHRSQSAELARLDAHRSKLEDDLTLAEEELAELMSASDLDRRQLANLHNERDRIYRRFALGGNGQLPPGVGDQLAALANRFPALHYDPATGVAKVDSDMLFASGDAEIGNPSRELLDEFARILKSESAQDLRLMVVGHTDDRNIAAGASRDHYPNNWHLSSARALRVADYLRAHGVDESRMGVAGFAKYQPVASNATEQERQLNRRVEIFLIAPDVPVVGWTETIPTVYR